MFSLIITIISIALVAALAVATIYYGGDAFNQGSSKALASTMVNHAQQIAGANTMLRATTGSYAADVAALQTGGYLSSVPVVDGVTYSVDAANVVSGVGMTAEVCEKIEEVAGRTGTDVLAAGTAIPATAQFGCFPLSGTATFFFKG